jgi:LDH2 family malate/lactate/ureidoglycolate dehydrogenase
MIVKPADELRELVTKILRSAGANEPNAVVVAQHLVLANLCGVDTHGVCHVVGYVEDIRAGLIVPPPARRSNRKRPARPW